MNYKNSFVFTEQGNTFTGVTRMDLNLNFIPDELDLDADLNEVRSVIVNGLKVDFTVRDHQILIPGSALQYNNDIVITFVGNLQPKSPGLVKYVDKNDGSVYLYSDNEPFNALKMFPCFDQPDIKTTFETTMIAPKRWTMVSNDLEDDKKIVNEIQVVHFPRTKLMSTYVYFLGGGDWVVWHDQWKNVPLRVMARKSVAHELDVENVFKLTKQGFNFFTRYFNMDFAYTKYDQMFVPDWGWGGMENVGAVTLNERYVHAATMDKKMLDMRDKTILHEMSHMWFGDLVTMKWWSDLWLNEAFARMMEELAFQSINKEAYNDVAFMTDKQRPMWIDLVGATHPVAQDMTCTHDADVSFDDLTYEKGASVLQQLSRQIGKRKFRKSVRKYFKEFAFSNTTYEDFVRVFSEVSHMDLRSWSEAWLRHDGVSKLKVEMSCEDGWVTEAKVRQIPLKGGQFLKHVTQYQTLDANLRLSRTRSLAIEGEVTELDELEGRKCPELVVLNTAGDDYAIQVLDEKEANFAVEHLTDIRALRTKLMLYYALALNYNLKTLSFDQFFKAATGIIRTAEEDALVEELISKLNPIIRAMMSLPTPEKTAAVNEMKALLLEKKEQVGSDRLKFQFDKMLGMIRL